MIATLYDNDSPAARCLELIERCAPLLMRVGGGALTQGYGSEGRAMPNRLTPEQKVKALELGRAGKLTGTQIALAVGFCEETINDFVVSANEVLAVMYPKKP